MKRNLTKGANALAILSWFGPVQIAYGITSPKNKTAVTDIMIAQTEGTSSSRKIGSASIAHALERSKVTNKK